MSPCVADLVLVVSIENKIRTQIDDHLINIRVRDSQENNKYDESESDSFIQDLQGGHPIGWGVPKIAAAYATLYSHSVSFSTHQKS